jgi:hypothetical protein
MQRAAFLIEGIVLLAGPTVAILGVKRQRREKGYAD